MADLIRYAGGFNDEAFTSMVTVERITSTQRRVSDVPSDLFDSFLLQNGDKVNAGEILDRFDNRVTIQGAVFRPGTYELTPGLTLSELIGKADGVRENVFSNRGLLLRLQEDLTPLNISFNVDEILQGIDDIALQREDAVVIMHLDNIREERYIRILGQVQEPGSFPYRDNMTLQDLIFLAKGFTEAASDSYIEVARRNSYEIASELSNQMVSLFRFEIDRNLNLMKDVESFKLQPFDYVYVRRAPSYFTQRTVSIKGEVQFPGDYSISTKTERISDLIRRAGGLTPEAFTNGAVLLRDPDNLKVIRAAMSTSGEEELLSSSAKNLLIPRLELRLDEILRSPGGITDYVLKEGDEIIIPEIVQEVRISGEILNPIGLAFEKGKSMKYYIERTGGYSSKAHRRKVFVIYSDGTADITRSFIFKKYPMVEPGSQIIVPEKPVKEGGDQTAKWLGIASTMSSLTLAIAAVLRVL